MIRSSGTLGANAQKQQRYFQPELDVVRFVAFFFVFIHHNASHDPVAFGASRWWAIPLAAFTNACGFGLCLFFTLSAYLICELLLREKERSRTIDIRSFYIRRVLRIWPLYFLGIGIGCVLALRYHQTGDLLLFGAFAIMAGNWFMVFVHSTGNPMGVLWSISVEEQFYLFCPLAIWKLTRRGLYILSAFILVVANLSLLFLGNHHNDTLLVWFNGLVQFQFFAVGMIVCLVLRGKLPKLPVSIRLAMHGSAVLLWFIACYVFHVLQLAPATSGLSLMTGYALVAFGCVLIIVGMLGVSSRLLPTWIIWLGKVSFGLYVFHMLATWLLSQLPPIFLTKGTIPFLLRIGVKLAITVLLAGLSYHFFEAHFLRMKQKFAAVESRPV
jgi:peptidoglycan/LPS O-acetylase OafA/YrhL